MTGKTNGEATREIEEAVEADLGSATIVCAECYCTFDSFGERCPYVNDEFPLPCEGFRQIDAAYDRVEARRRTGAG